MRGDIGMVRKKQIMFSVILIAARPGGAVAVPKPNIAPCPDTVSLLLDSVVKSTGYPVEDAEGYMITVETWTASIPSVNASWSSSSYPLTEIKTRFIYDITQAQA